MLSAIIAAGAAEAVFTPEDPAETTRALLGMCQSITRWHQPGGPLTLAQVAQRYIGIALLAIDVSPVAISWST